MKIKFKSALHRKTFMEFITANVKNPYLSRNEYIAAVFLLSADKFLWKRARRALTGYSVNFSSLNLSGISTEGYALFRRQRRYTAAAWIFHYMNYAMRICSMTRP